MLECKIIKMTNNKAEITMDKYQRYLSNYCLICDFSGKEYDCLDNVTLASQDNDVVKKMGKSGTKNAEVDSINCLHRIVNFWLWKKRGQEN
jgi:hypothetical protein